jgi:O-antigen ligase
VLTNSRASQVAEIVLLTLGFILLVRTRREFASWALFAVPSAMMLFLLSPLLNVIIGLFAPAPLEASDLLEEPNALEEPNVPDSIAANPIQPRASISEDSRFTIWSVALNLWSTSPLWGRGFGQFISISRTEQAGAPQLVHNSFLSFLVETGVFGAFIFAYAFVFLAFLLLRAKTLTCSVLSIALAASCVMMLSNNLENARSLWIFMGATYAWVVASTSSKLTGFTFSSSNNSV